jgi:hypothetical protein
MSRAFAKHSQRTEIFTKIAPSFLVNYTRFWQILDNKLYFVYNIIVECDSMSKLKKGGDMQL